MGGLQFSAMDRRVNPLALRSSRIRSPGNSDGRSDGLDMVGSSFDCRFHHVIVWL